MPNNSEAITATQSDFTPRQVVIRGQKAAEVTIEGHLVGHIISPTGCKHYILVFDYAGRMKVSTHETILDCLEVAESLYAPTASQ